MITFFYGQLISRFTICTVGSCLAHQRSEPFFHGTLIAVLYGKLVSGFAVFTVSATCGNTAIHAINMPISILNGDYGRVSVLAGHTLNTLHTLHTLESLCAVGDLKRSGFTVGKGDGVSIHQTLSGRFLDARNTVTGVSLHTLGGNAAIHAVNIPVSILNGDHRGAAVLAWHTLNTLYTLHALETLRAVSNLKRSGFTVGKGNGVSIHQTLGERFLDGRNAIAVFAVNARCGNAAIHAVNVPVSVLNGDHRGAAVLAGHALNTLYTLYALNTLCAVGYREGGGITICKGNGVSIYKTFAIRLFNGDNAIAILALDLAQIHGCVGRVQISSIKIPVHNRERGTAANGAVSVRRSQDDVHADDMLQYQHSISRIDYIILIVSIGENTLCFRKLRHAHDGLLHQYNVTRGNVAIHVNVAHSVNRDSHPCLSVDIKQIVSSHGNVRSATEQKGGHTVFIGGKAL